MDGRMWISGPMVWRYSGVRTRFDHYLGLSPEISLVLQARSWSPEVSAESTESAKDQRLSTFQKKVFWVSHRGVLPLLCI